MDHFTIPAGTTHILVPYKCTELYDGGDFFGYPARKGWTEDELLGRRGFGNRTDAEVEAFFQTWLYFGMLTSVFKLNGIKVDPKEFLTTDKECGQVIVTTSEALPRRLRDWRMKGNRDAESDAATATVALITQVATYIDRYCGVEGREHEGSMRAPTTAVTWTVAPEISMSITALGFIFTGAIREIYKAGTFNMGWGANPMLKTTLLKAGWCPLDVRRLFLDVGIDGQYYLALAKFPHDTGLHRRCDERACRARTVDEGTYVIPHLHTGRKCQEDVATRGVVQIIQNEGIPVLSWSKNIDRGGSGFIIEDARTSKLPYVAISHVYVTVLPPDSKPLTSHISQMGRRTRQSE